MPYKTNKELPDGVKNHLPSHAQTIYREAYNSAWDEYSESKDRRGGDSREATAHQVAWSAVKHKYEKPSDSDKWVEKQ